jgi:adenine-specific DNA methylase
MIWDYVEVNPVSNSTGNIATSFEYVLRVLDHLIKIQSPSKAQVSNYNAAALGYPDSYFDAVFTDPPYYNSVPYADLSDFFYVWLKRILGEHYPDLFSTPLTPKKNEITEMAGWDPVRYPEKDKTFFETNLGKAFKEIYRVLKPDGITTIVYAHKSTAGWETVINALLDSGLVITASWPLNTEMQNRMRANESATLSSSIYIVARKTKRQLTGFYNNAKEELKKYLAVKLDHLWSEGITGADFFIAAIGSGIEIYGQYEKVMDYEGNVKRADVLLDDVREIVMQYTVKQILHNGFSGEISDLAKFYVVWRFSFGEAKVEFDDANKIARSVGIDLSKEWANKGFIKKEKEFIRVLVS